MHAELLPLPSTSAWQPSMQTSPRACQPPRRGPELPLSRARAQGPHPHACSPLPSSLREWTRLRPIRGCNVSSCHGERRHLCSPKRLRHGAPGSKQSTGVISFSAQRVLHLNYCYSALAQFINAILTETPATSTCFIKHPTPNKTPTVAASVRERKPKLQNYTRKARFEGIRLCHQAQRAQSLPHLTPTSRPRSDASPQCI